MAIILDMAQHKAKKLDCRGENANGPDTCERRASAAAALARLVREMRADFGDKFAAESLGAELYVIRYGGK